MAAGVDLGIESLDDVEIIGQGGFSTVYGASHTLLKRRVAVKVLNTLTKESERRRFERECEVLGRLSDHPNVVTVYQAGYTSDDHPYLIMEMVRGGTLADLLAQRHQVSWTEAVDYLVPVCEALGRAHEESILHRDVKPENILLADGMPRLADFGIAYLRDATGATSTHITASWLHTPPETFDNKRDERSDLYSAASTLYNLIAGHAPFWQAGDESLNPLMARLLYEPAPDLPPGLAPAALNDFLQRALAKDPDQRPQSAAQFVAELTEIRTGVSEPVQPRPSRPVPDPSPLVDREAKTQYAPPAAEASPTVAAPAAPESSPTVAAPPAPQGPPVMASGFRSVPNFTPPAPGFVPPGPSFVPPASYVQGFSSIGSDTTPDRSKAPGGVRAVIVLAALAALIGDLAYSSDAGLFDFGSTEEIIAYTISVPALVLVALVALLSGRRTAVGGVAFAIGVSAPAFDLVLPIRYMFELGGVSTGALGVVISGCAVLIITGLILLPRDPSIGAVRVVALIVTGLVIVGASVPAYQHLEHQWSVSVGAYAIGVVSITLAAIFARGGAVPLVAGLFGLGLTLTTAHARFSLAYVSEDNPGLVVLAFGFLVLSIIGLAQVVARGPQPRVGLPSAPR